MRRELRPLALFACITAAGAFGGQIASANTTTPKDNSEVKCDQQKQGHRHQGHRRDHFLKKMSKELGLSEQQTVQAKALLEKSRADNKPLFQGMMAEKQQLRKLVLSGSADEAAIRAQSAKVASVEADLAVRRSQEAKQFVALLTPDQATKLRAMLEKRHEKFRKSRSGEEGGPMM